MHNRNTTVRPHSPLHTRSNVSAMRQVISTVINSFYSLLSASPSLSPDKLVVKPDAGEAGLVTMLLPALVALHSSAGKPQSHPPDALDHSPGCWAQLLIKAGWHQKEPLVN